MNEPAGQKNQGGRLVLVSNRLPIVVSETGDGWTVEGGSGGLVTAMAPVLRNRGGVWIGWSGTTDIDPAELDGLLEESERHSGAGQRLRPVSITREEMDHYYYGFANEIIWPLFHDLPSRCNYDPRYWTAYESVNRKFARVVADNLKDDDYIWIHDYHLMHVGQNLRELGVEQKIGFFLHIPFPPIDLFMKLPWRFHVLSALLECDLLGFQTLRDRRNFLQCVRLLVKDTTVVGKGQVVNLRRHKRDVRVGVFPISIDFQEFAEHAASEEVSNRAWLIHEHLPNMKIILGVDRLDYTKGIPERLRAFASALERYPDLRERVVLMQVVVPSRRKLPRYEDLKEEIERMVGEINGRFTASGWVPIHYIFRSMDRSELLAYYRTAEVGFVTPLKDGMNLVAKEYCASSLEDGVLILSEFAGAAAQLQSGALLVNPNDIEGMADAVHEAVEMPRDKRLARMRRLRSSVKRYDIYWWVNSFLDAAFAKRLDNFPVVEDYLPTMESE